jgi:hypothetical protein
MVASTYNYQVRRIPTYLKHLVENRARADGQVQRLEDALVDIQTELTRALAHRDACDRLLNNFDGLGADGIAPIRGWLGKRGGRGRWVGTMREFIRQSGSGGITTTELSARLMEHFELDFTPAERRTWMRRSVRNRLNELRARGEIEPTDPARLPGSTPYRWRIPQHSTSALGALIESVRMLGVQVEVADDGTPDDTHRDA